MFELSDLDESESVASAPTRLRWPTLLSLEDVTSARLRP